MIVEITKPITTAKIEKATALINKERRKGFNAGKHIGKLKNVFGDALEYQKYIRNEWI
jgi:hypothetical protein